MILSGEDIKRFGLLRNADEKNMQAQGWDVRVEKVYHIVSKPYGEKIKEEDYKEFSLPYGTVPPNTSVLFKLMETVDLRSREGLPCVNALVLPKSSLTRRGVTVHSAWWDAGYVGSGMVLVRTSDIPLRIKPGDSFGQMIFFVGQSTNMLYEGQYQGEGIKKNLDSL
jgi:deoxycytidine triphosphate deaminase